MAQFTQLLKRNINLYLRDKGAVFFSLLSMLVVICLMIFFLEDINIDMLTENLANLPDRNAVEDEKNAVIMILTWTAAGIIPTNAVMVTLSSLSSMIKDKTSGKSDSIYSSPVSRFTIALAYIAAACICSVIICTLTFGISEVYLCIKGAELFTLKVHLQIFAIIAVNSFVYSAIMYLFAVLIKSEGAWSSMGTVFGVLVGFLGGIYMPVGSLSAGLQSVIKCTPVIYSTVMFRQIMTQGISNKIFNGVRAEMVDEYKNTMGITIEVFDKNISPLNCSLILIAFGLVFLIIGAALTNRKTGAK